MFDSSGGRFTAIGRVFSGTISSGSVVHILGANYVKGEKHDVVMSKSIKRTKLLMANVTSAIDHLVAGCVVGIDGIDKYLVKTGTLVSDINASPIISMKYSVSPVVRRAIKPKMANDITKLVTGIQKLIKSDPLLLYIHTAEHIIAGAGELHLEISMTALQELSGIPLVISDPVVQYKETISTNSTQKCLAKTANKLNRIYAEASPLNEELVEYIESGELTPWHKDKKNFCATLKNKYDWHPSEVKKVWCVDGTNFLVDMTKGVQYLQDIKDHCIQAFQQIIRNGVLSGEELRGCRFNILDALIHSDSSHRGAGQIIQAATRVFQAAQRCAGPMLVEPYYKLAIQVPQLHKPKVYSVVLSRRGVIIDEVQTGSAMTTLSGYLPVAESFGFTKLLRAKTSGTAFPQSTFDHWETMDSDPLSLDSRTNKIICAIRKRKKLSADVTELNKLCDKL